MAQEKWTTEKEEMDFGILKPIPSPPHMFLKPPLEIPLQLSEKSDSSSVESNVQVFSSRIKDLESSRSNRFTNRCNSCRKRVGLTGFKCKCGHLYCAKHRFSEIHRCDFDYKAIGREAISKANPVIKPAKIIKI